MARPGTGVQDKPWHDWSVVELYRLRSDLAALSRYYSERDYDALADAAEELAATYRETVTA